MNRPPKSDDVVVWYQAPGDDTWRVTAEERRDLLRRARELLAKADVEVRQAERRRLRREEEKLGLEREMAAALGAWERWIAAGAKQIFVRGQEVVETASREAWDAVRKVFKVPDDD